MICAGYSFLLMIRLIWTALYGFVCPYEPEPLPPFFQLSFVLVLPNTSLYHFLPCPIQRILWNSGDFPCILINLFGFVILGGEERREKEGRGREEDRRRKGRRGEDRKGGEERKQDKRQKHEMVLETQKQNIVGRPEGSVRRRGWGGGAGECWVKTSADKGAVQWRRTNRVHFIRLRTVTERVNPSPLINYMIRLMMILVTIETTTTAFGDNKPPTIPAIH